VTSTRNCTTTEIEPGLGATTGAAHYKLPKAILHLVLGALFLLLLAVTAQQAAWAQAGRPQGAPTQQGQNPYGMLVYIWAGLKSHGLGQHD
jgi:hypothetical protein